MPLFEICAECYPKYFPVYPEMEIKISSERHKCSGCGKFKRVVRKVTVGREVIDIN